LLFFAAVLAYVRARERGARAPWAGAAVLGAAAMLAKPSAVVLPIVVAAYEHWLRPDPRPRLALPLLPISIAAAIPTALAHVGTAISAETLSLSTLLGTVYPTMTVIFWRYVALLVWPADLNAFHDAALYGWLDGPVVAASAAWIATFALVFTRGSREVRFWFAWFWICFLPTSNVLPLPTYYADRYLYAPAVGAFALAGLGVRRAHDALAALGRTRAAAAVLAGVAFVAATAGAAAWRRADVWRDDVALWEDTVRRSPNLHKPRVNLAFAYFVRGRFDEAEQQYEAALRIAPDPEVARDLEKTRAMRALTQTRAR
jgi:hypothetical protein